MHCGKKERAGFMPAGEENGHAEEKRSAKTGRRVVVCAALALCLCGCQVPRPELPVVGEKKTESRAGGGYGAEGGAAEKGENPGGEMGWKDAPSSYAPQVRTETIRLAGEGEVQVPQEAALPAYRVVNEPYSEAEYGRYKEIVREIYGISWKEGERTRRGNFPGMECIIFLSHLRTCPKTRRRFSGLTGWTRI